jgi:hypothetical protein
MGLRRTDDRPPGHGSIPGGLPFIPLRLLAKPASPSEGTAGF